MSKFDGRKIKKAALEANMFLPGVGEISKELSSQTNAVSKAIDMHMEGDYVVLKIRNKSTHAEAELLVPISRFTYISLEKEEVKPLAKPLR